ncbi:MAG: hypothetical protein E3K32_10970 [wastewater metagenome]|nr:hypothetical protein [Candidatus Loosdrechtia aerotolerans]
MSGYVGPVVAEQVVYIVLHEECRVGYAGCICANDPTAQAWLLINSSVYVFWTYTGLFLLLDVSTSVPPGYFNCRQEAVHVGVRRNGYRTFS